MQSSNMPPREQCRRAPIDGKEISRTAHVHEPGGSPVAVPTREVPGAREGREGGRHQTMMSRTLMNSNESDSGHGQQDERRFEEVASKGESEMMEATGASNRV